MNITNKNCKWLVLVVAQLAFLLPTCYAQNADDFYEIKGVPDTRVVSTSDETYRVKLDEKDKNEYALAIIKKDDGYVWLSRESKSLIHTQSGAFDLFINPDGTGYVKVARDASVMNPLRGLTASVTKEQFGCKYIEHMSDKLNTITYFGNCEVS